MSDKMRVFRLVAQELDRATKKHGPFISDAVGLAGIVEEVGELAEALLKGKPNSELRAEAIQVAAMGVRFVIDRCPESGDGKQRKLLESHPSTLFDSSYILSCPRHVERMVSMDAAFPPPPGVYPMEVLYPGQPPLIIRVNITKVDEKRGTFKMIPEPGYCPHATSRQCNHPLDPEEYTDDCGLTDEECDFEDTCEDYEKCWRYQKDRAEMLERHRKMLINVVRMARKVLAGPARDLRHRLNSATRYGKTTVLAHEACVNALKVINEDEEV